jgi:hypothetical protein
MLAEAYSSVGLNDDNGCSGEPKGVVVHTEIRHSLLLADSLSIVSDSVLSEVTLASVLVKQKMNHMFVMSYYAQIMGGRF